MLENMPAAATAGTVLSAAAILGALIAKSTDFVKYAAASLTGAADRRKNGRNGLATLLLTAVAGVGAALLFQATNWADEIKIGDETLKQLDFASIMVFGLVASTVASTIYDFKKAVDSSDSAKTPELLPPD